MTTHVLNWDVNGEMKQEFTLGIIRDSNKNEIKNSTYIIDHLVPGVPYTITSHVVNQNSGIIDTHNPLANGEYAWFTSNIDSLLFTKEHAMLVNVSGMMNEMDSTQITITVVNAINDTDVLEALKTYKIKFDFFLESEENMECFHSYEIDITDSVENFNIPMSVSGTLNVYYSMMVDPRTPTQLSEDWYYVIVHQHLCQILPDSIPENSEFDSEELGVMFNTY